jgi:hypothetical protein
MILGGLPSIAVLTQLPVIAAAMATCMPSGLERFFFFAAGILNEDT